MAHQYPGKKMLSVYVDENVHRELKVYSVQTGKTLMGLIEPLTKEFEQGALKLVSEITAMRKKQYEEELRNQEAQKLASENPLQVSGHEEDPIGTSIEETIPSV